MDKEKHPDRRRQTKKAKTEQSKGVEHFTAPSYRALAENLPEDPQRSSVLLTFNEEGGGMIARALLTQDPKSKALNLIGVDNNLFTRLELFTRSGVPRNVLINHITGKEVRTIEPTFLVTISQDGTINGDISGALREHLVKLDEDVAIFAEHFYNDNFSAGSRSRASESPNIKTIESRDRKKS